jgi:hypothetical protein
MTPCELTEYRQIVGKLPRPSDAQIDAFISFVSEAHSWYKHLPLLPPGIEFRFFLDPFSGFDRVLKRGGGVLHQERTDDSPRFHYTWMTTNEYRRRFGHLSYDANAGMRFILQSGGESREYGERSMFATESVVYHIPREIAQAGAVALTGIIHRSAARAWLWQNISASSRQGFWPEETGGRTTLEQILGLCRQAALSGNQSAKELDAAIEKLGLPERLRLQEQMRAAIKKMLYLVYCG